MVSGLSVSGHRQHGVFHELARMARAATKLSLDIADVKKDGEEELAELAIEGAEESNGQKEFLNDLGARDREVIGHEAAHMAAAGSYVMGGASYTYQTGPDGRRYAIGGEVQVDMSPIPGNPRATIAKMQAIRSAALAPDSPSAQDLSVAAVASQVESQARMELSRNAITTTSFASAKAPIYGSPSAVTGFFVNAAA